MAWDLSGDGTTAVRAGIGRFYQRDRVSPGLGVGTNPPFSGTASIVRTLNSAAVVSGNPAPAYGSASNSLEEVEANSNYWQWNVAFEKQLVRNTVAEIAYVGSKGQDLFGQTNLNEVAPANRLAYLQTGNAAHRPLNGIEGIGDGNVALWQHNRESIYHSLQVAVNSRFGHGSHVALAYTWAKLMANTGVGNADGPGISNFNAYTDSTQPDLDRSRGATDRTHVFSGSLIWALPTLEEKSGFMKHILGNWQFTTIVQAGTGYPLTPSQGPSPDSPGTATRLPVPATATTSRGPTWSKGRTAHANTDDKTQYLNPGGLDSQRVRAGHQR